MTENIKFCLALRVLREARGWTAGELSQRAGMANYTVSRLETGKLSLDFATAVVLAGQLGVSLDSLAAAAATLPAALLEQETQLAQARKGMKALRKETRTLRQGLGAG